jgi:hypothetical protein
MGYTFWFVFSFGGYQAKLDLLAFSF